LRALQCGPRDVAAEISERMGQTCNQLAGHGPTHFALSGGVDSRMLLAAALANGIHPNIALHSHAMSRASMLDTKSAELIAKHVNMPIHIEKPEGGWRNDIADPEWQDRALLHHDLSTGFANALNGQIKRGILEWIPKDSVWMRGNMLELVGAIWWPAPHKLPSVDHIMHAVIRSQVNYTTQDQCDHRYALMEGWVKNLPEQAQPVMHDFNYIENTLPYTQSGLLSVNHCFYTPPACDRRIFELSMAVTFGKRRKRRLFRQIMLKSYPSMMDVPMAGAIADAIRAEKSAT
jgi:hypothetical protein